MEKEPWNSSDEKSKTLKLEDFGNLDEVLKMAFMPINVNSFLEARNILESFVGKLMTSKSGLTASISKKSIKEILSGKAAGKSFDIKAHLKAAVNIEKLFYNAIEKWEFSLDPNKDNDSLKDRKYLYAPMAHNDLIIPVKLTIKEYKDIKAEKRLYSIQAINVEIK